MRGNYFLEGLKKAIALGFSDFYFLLLVWLFKKSRSLLLLSKIAHAHPGIGIAAGVVFFTDSFLFDQWGSIWEGYNWDWKYKS